MTSTAVKEIVGVGAVGSILAYLRSIPTFIWTKIKAKISVSIEILDDDRNGDYLKKWLELWLSKQSDKVYRNLKAVTDYNIDPNIKDKYGDLSTEPVCLLLKEVEHNPGWFKYQGKKLLVTCHKRETQTTGKVFYDYNLTFFSRDPQIAVDFMRDIREQYIEQSGDGVVCMVYKGGDWKKVKNINPRTFDSVILPEGKVETIKADIDLFMERKQLYTDLNITHKRGYLFEGLPGTGKSTIANAIAYYLKWNLYAFNKTDIKKGTLSDAFSSIKSRSVVLLEDIDTYKLNRGANDEAEDTGDWLNWLDGINSPNDCIFVMTTNYVEKLDPALIRDGRVDFSMNFSYVTEFQIRESFKRFHLSATTEEIEEFVERHKDKNIVMADIQNDLFKLYVPAWRETELLLPSSTNLDSQLEG